MQSRDRAGLALPHAPREIELATDMWRLDMATKADAQIERRGTRFLDRRRPMGSLASMLLAKSSGR